jgi:hypothetical protein
MLSCNSYIGIPFVQMGEGSAIEIASSVDLLGQCEKCGSRVSGRMALICEPYGRTTGR